jgi:hypothetical protein
MRLTGREIQGLLGAMMLHAHVPFVRAKKAVLHARDLAVVDEVGARLRIARDALKPDIPRETPGWLEALLDAEIEVPMTDLEVGVLVKVTTPCLDELRTDSGLSALVGPGVGLEALRSVHEKVASQRKPLRLLEAFLAVAFAVCALVAMTVATPLLTPPPSTWELVFPRLVQEQAAPFQIRTEKGTVRVESVEPFGCILIVASDGTRVGPVCNRQMRCLDGAQPPSFPAPLSVYRASGGGEYYADVGSACHSACCDRSGIRFSGRGKRLDDGPLQRVGMRLGASGIVLLIVGAAGGLLRLLGRRWLGWRIATVLGFASALTILCSALWWNG